MQRVKIEMGGGRPAVSFSHDGLDYLMSRVSTGLTLQLRSKLHE